MTLLDELRSTPGFWYVATPYTSYRGRLCDAFLDACRVTAWLLKQNVRCYSPITATHSIAEHGGIDPLDHDFWMAVDRPLMDAACGIVIVKLYGWEESEGITCEMARFVASGKPVRYLDWPQESLSPLLTLGGHSPGE